MTSERMIVSSFSAEELGGALPELGALLRACVEAGASINFVMPFRQDEAEAFWRLKTLPGLESGLREMWVARRGERIVGSVQLDLDTPPNQPHRAEVSKLMTHPEARRLGAARALMAALEGRAAALGRTLLTLDTRTGDAAEPLYASLGYRTVGVIPGFCVDPLNDRLDSTTIMYKTL